MTSSAASSSPDQPIELPENLTAEEYSQIGEKYANEGQLEIAQQAFEKVLEQAPDGELAELAQNYLKEIERVKSEQQVIYDTLKSMLQDHKCCDDTSGVGSKRMMAEYYASIGDEEKASSLYEEYLADLEKEVGADSSDLADELYMIGAASSIKGMHKRAVKLLKRAVEIQRKQSEEKQSEIVFTLDSLAKSLTALESFDEAREARKEALSLLEEKYGDSHWSQRECLHGLLELACLRGDEEEENLFSNKLEQLSEPDPEEQALFLEEHSRRFTKMLSRSMEGIGALVELLGSETSEKQGHSHGHEHHHDHEH